MAGYTYTDPDGVHIAGLRSRIASKAKATISRLLREPPPKRNDTPLDFEYALSSTTLASTDVIYSFTEEESNEDYSLRFHANRGGNPSSPQVQYTRWYHGPKSWKSSRLEKRVFLRLFSEKQSLLSKASSTFNQPQQADLLDKLEGTSGSVPSSHRKGFSNLFPSRLGQILGNVQECPPKNGARFGKLKLVSISQANQHMRHMNI